MVIDNIYSIVISVYNSEQTLQGLCECIEKTFEEIDGDYELILVEDCGTDGSWELMKSLRQENKKIKIIKLMRNFGQHNAAGPGTFWGAINYNQAFLSGWWGIHTTLRSIDGLAKDKPGLSNRGFFQKRGNQEHAQKFLQV